LGTICMRLDQVSAHTVGSSDHHGDHNVHVDTAAATYIQLAVIWHNLVQSAAPLMHFGACQVRARWTFSFHISQQISLRRDGLFMRCLHVLDGTATKGRLLT
jgi:hypothetical protein